MPPELRKAHQLNDRVVMQAYSFDIKTTTESSCVAALMKLHQVNFVTIRQLSKGKLLA